MFLKRFVKKGLNLNSNRIYFLHFNPSLFIFFPLQSSRQELLKSESFQFGSLYPESKSGKENMGPTEDIAVKQMEDSTVQITSLGSIKQDEYVPAMGLNPSKCLGPKR